MKVSTVQNRVAVLYHLARAPETLLQDYERTKGKPFFSRVTGALCLGVMLTPLPAPPQELLFKDLLSPSGAAVHGHRGARPMVTGSPRRPWTRSPSRKRHRAVRRPTCNNSRTRAAFMVRLNGMGQPGKEPTVFPASSQKGRGGLACLTSLLPRTTS